jgi:acetyl esterase/lipase
MLRKIIWIAIAVIGLSVVVTTLRGPANRVTAGAAEPAPLAGTIEFASARKDFKTAVQLPSSAPQAPPTPPAGVFRLVDYPAAPGPLPAYLTPDPKDGKKHPAIIWITGGDCNSIGEMWRPEPRDNDQSAAAFRKAGLVMMVPSLRGGNRNPGHEEAFAGEIDDVLAAADFLAKQPYVEPTRIYLGGHSTGGTLVLLTAEASARFRAVFAFGPVGQAAIYGADFLRVDLTKLTRQEATLRAPDAWLPSVHSPVFVLEGTGRGNIGELERMRQKSRNPLITFVAVKGASHFSILAPVTEVIARKISQDTGNNSNIQLSEAELSALF